MSKDEAVRLAEEKELDLVEIAPTAKPPVAKILDFRKFLYEENKKEQIAKKNAKEVELKEIWLSPRIGEHDLVTRLRRMDEFFDDGNKVQLRVKFKGREMANTKLGFDLLQNIFQRFAGKLIIDRAPKMEGRSITAIVGRGKAASAAKANEPAKDKVVESNPIPVE